MPPAVGKISEALLRLTRGTTAEWRRGPALSPSERTDWLSESAPLSFSDWLGEQRQCGFEFLTEAVATLSRVAMAEPRGLDNSEQAELYRR